MNYYLHGQTCHQFVGSHFHCAGKMSSQKNCTKKCAQKAIKHRKSALKSIKSSFYSFAFKNQNFTQIVEIFAQTGVCVSTTFRNSGSALCSVSLRGTGPYTIFCSHNIEHRCSTRLNTGVPQKWTQVYTNIPIYMVIPLYTGISLIILVLP